jgi:hypothetical protein
MIRLRAGLACLLLSLAASAAAQDEGIGSIQLKPGVCTTAKAKTLTLAALLATPDVFERQCVRVRGVAAGAIVYPDRPSYEQAMGPAGGHVRRIGLYGDPALLEQLPQRPTPTEVVGQVALCGGRPFIAGYCHYAADGVILIASETRTIPEGQ